MNYTSAAMDNEYLVLIARWLHIAPVIIAVGGAVFIRFVLMPATGAALADDVHAALHEQIIRRWRRFVHACIGLILLSGLYNVVYEIVIIGKPTLYHVLFLPKFLCALGIFFLASVLVGRSPALAGLRSDGRRVMSVVVALAVIIVLVSGYMRSIPDKPRIASDTVPAVTQP